MKPMSAYSSRMSSSNADENCVAEFRNYSLKFGHQKILSDINLSFKKNQVTSIVGPSGCGKSSLLLSMSGLLSSDGKIQQHGNILLNEKCMLDRPNHLAVDFKRKIGIVFQKPQPFMMSIKKNILLPLREHFRLSPAEQDGLVEEVLKTVGLWNEVKDRLNESAMNLSGGQQQRLCLARSLVLKPELILMDEPCSALDPISTQVIEELIKHISKFCTIVIVTHNIGQARRVSQNMAVFWLNDNGGFLVESGLTNSLFKNPGNSITRNYLNGLQG